jgi:hypothetical protein
VEIASANPICLDPHDSKHDNVVKNLNPQNYHLPKSFPSYEKIFYLGDIPPLTQLKIKIFYRTKVSTPERGQTEVEPHNFCCNPFPTPNLSS